MSERRASVSRREFISGAAALTGGTLMATGSASAQEGSTQSGGGSSGPIDYGGYLDDAPYWGGDGSTVDARGQSEVKITVGGSANGNLSFEPAAVHVDPGTTVVWEWSGKGGAHNVHMDSDAPEQFESEIIGEEGATYEHTPQAEGIYPYYCQPHQSQGMLGALAVGQVPHKDTSGPPTRTPPDPEEMGVPIRSHYVGIAAISVILLSVMFTFYTMKYGLSAHTKTGN